MPYEILHKLLGNNRSGETLNSIGAVIHETANPNDSDEMEWAYFNGAYRAASAHAFIDHDSITQCIPWGEIAWHAGHTANRKFWGIEMCHTNSIIRFNEIWKRSTWLIAYLFFNNKILTVTNENLMSHAEVSNKWKETDHQDPISYFAKFGKTVDDFRNDVQELINGMVVPIVVEDAQLKSDIQILSSYTNADGTPMMNAEYWLANTVEGSKPNPLYVAKLIKNLARKIIC
jgi:hypothetical protein